jgi:ribosomal protein L37AE/L43A
VSRTEDWLRQIPDTSGVRIVVQQEGPQAVAALECRACDLLMKTSSGVFWYCPDCGYEIAKNAADLLAVEAVQAVVTLSVGKVGRWRRILLWLLRLGR